MRIYRGLFQRHNPVLRLRKYFLACETYNLVITTYYIVFICCTYDIFFVCVTYYVVITIEYLVLTT